MLNGLQSCVLGLVAEVYFTFAATVCNWNSAPIAASHLSVFSVGIWLLLWSYYKACVLDPGFTNLEIPHDGDDPEAALNPKSSFSSPNRFCDKCDPPRVKPPRAHHCRQCKRCVEKMDHHCPWLNNCVGRDNYKAFLLFVAYVMVCCVYAASILVSRFVAIILHPIDKPMELATWHILMIGITMLILLPLTASMAVLGSWHAYLLAKNMTTIEYFAEERTRMSGVVRSDAWRWPYDVGLLGNIQSVFGARWLDWLRPDCSAEVITYRWAEDDVEDQQELGVGWQAGSTEAGGMTDSSSDA
mmetsp:Transcript_44673/g.72723  ORF Transcript_44673/g.72723 Transcript_44673/m.72723 type:complete len:300 (+) Transcript_44673:182-1081(+)